MKKVFLIIGAMAVSFTTTAQHHRIERYHHGHGEPTVYLISVS